jgi:LmbE family N-acetylglucosaminyl deacetylase/glycosyltransferase involved in cell wall biosynthesis
MTERDLIPYESTDLAGGQRVIVFAPHPDDETVGCGGTLALHRKAGDEVRVVFVSSGEKGLEETDVEKARGRRENEAASALPILGITDFEFWRYPDRAVAADGALVERIHTAVRASAATLLDVPSPLEIHPDHRALAHAVRAALRGWPDDLRVVFYEVGYVLPPNILVDITAVADEKDRAIRAYESQLERLDYLGVARGLARFRSLTLGGRAVAEAFRLTPARRMESDAIWRWQALQEPQPAFDGPPAVSVVVRTKDRPNLLHEALDSLAAQTFRDFEVVLVNDGGRNVDAVVADFPNLRINPVPLPTNRGRAAAANAGVAAARGQFIAYLDDDDVYYPPHLETLHAFLAEHDHFAAVYSDAHSAKYRLNPETSAYELVERTVEHSQDFEPDLLLFHNYIHNFCLMHRRDAWQRLGGFDERCTVLEDWDFFIRLAEIAPFQHLARCTAEYRQRNDGTNVSQTAIGTVAEEVISRIELYRRHWQRHSPERTRRVYDKLRAEVWNGKHWTAEARRLERERDATITERDVVIRERDAAIGERDAVIGERNGVIRERDETSAELRAIIAQKEEELAARVQALNAQGQELVARIQALSARLDEREGQLRTIYASRTWKLFLFFDAINRRLRAPYRRLKRLFGQSALPET